MSRIASYAASIGVAAIVFFGGAASGRSPVAVLSPATPSSVAEVLSASADAGFHESTQAVCEKFYSSLDEKKRSAERKNKAETVAAVERIKAILKARDAEVSGKTTSAATPALDNAENQIAEAVPKADDGWYALIRNNRYDYDHKYAPLCSVAAGGAN